MQPTDSETWVASLYPDPHLLQFEHCDLRFFSRETPTLSSQWAVDSRALFMSSGCIQHCMFQQGPFFCDTVILRRVASVGEVDEKPAETRSVPHGWEYELRF